MDAPAPGDLDAFELLESITVSDNRYRCLAISGSAKMICCIIISPRHSSDSTSNTTSNANEEGARGEIE